MAQSPRAQAHLADTVRKLLPARNHLDSPLSGVLQSSQEFAKEVLQPRVL